jgi:two-component system, response regulator AauR
MPKILVIDDDPLALATLELVLETGRGGDVVESAKSAEAAILLSAASHFDVIVSDIRMPGLDGIDLLKQTQTADRSIPVILLTGDDDLDLEYHARRLGAFAFFQKPVSPSRLLRAVEEAVEQSATSRWARQGIHGNMENSSGRVAHNAERRT